MYVDAFCHLLNKRILYGTLFRAPSYIVYEKVADKFT